MTHMLSLNFKSSILVQQQKKTTNSKNIFLRTTKQNKASYLRFNSD